jgi:hypothetical protein
MLFEFHCHSLVTHMDASHNFLSYLQVTDSLIYTTWYSSSCKCTICGVEHICTTSAFGCELRWMFGVNQHFGKHCSCHFQCGYVVGQVLEALYRPDSEWWDRVDGADWWSHSLPALYQASRTPELSLPLECLKLNIFSFHSFLDLLNFYFRYFTCDNF